MTLSLQAENADEIIKASGVKGGLVVQVGQVGKLTAELYASDAYLVHGLDVDQKNVNTARKYIQSKGLYGKVSVDVFDGETLPYADNLVNLIVVNSAIPARSATHSVAGGRVPQSEIERVLAPKGVALIKANIEHQTSNIEHRSKEDGVFEISKLDVGCSKLDVQGETWSKFTKPWPKEIDEWTHQLYGPDGNAVSRDLKVGPPGTVQWIAGPVWSKHHNLVPTVTTLVSAKGRIYYIVDESPAGVTKSPGQWFLIARDAFNGIELWRKPIEEWGWPYWTAKMIARFNHPSHIGKRLVAVGNNVYATLGVNAPIIQIDGVTGERLQVYTGTENTSEFIIKDNRLLAVVADKAHKPSGKGGAPSSRQVVAIDAKNGKVLWKSASFVGITSKVDSMINMKDALLCAGDQRVFFGDEKHIICLDLVSGVEQWRFLRPEYDVKTNTQFDYNFPGLATMVYHKGVVAFAQPKALKRQQWNEGSTGDLIAISASEGKELWRTIFGVWGHYNPPDVFFINDQLWVHAQGQFVMRVLDPLSGHEIKRVSTDVALDAGHHHRCYRNKATKNFIITSRRGLEFVDVSGGNTLRHPWVRGVCRYGIIPANGLVYAPPHPCACYLTAKLNNFHALGGKITFPEKAGYTEHGPAFDKRSQLTTQQPNNTTTVSDWPMYRGDIKRSGSTHTSISPDLTVRWKQKFNTAPTAVTATKEIILTSVKDENHICALSSADGSVMWKYYTDGSVDTPPTIYKGTAIFGSDHGWVYCVTLSDGQLVWRFFAGSGQRLIVDNGRLSSVWKVHGSVMVLNDKIYIAAGRSSFLDDGIRIYCLNPVTGEKLSETKLNSSVLSKKLTEEEKKALPYDLSGDDPGALDDILVSDGQDLYMRHVKISPDTLKTSMETSMKNAKKKMHPGKYSYSLQKGKDYLYSSAGLLDKSWFDRVGWVLSGSQEARCEYLVFNEQYIFGVSAYGEGAGRGKYHAAGSGYDVFKYDRDNSKIIWNIKVPIKPIAMVLAANRLFIAGTPEKEGSKGADLYVLTSENAEILKQYHLESLPTFDGMALVEGKLFVSLMNGSLICFNSK
ncbi:PQQ-binding-like beta-propeller repeat protein [Verrucomicrobiota bacterium]